MLKKITLGLIFLFVVTTTFAQRAGSLDTTFNHTGIVYNYIGGDTVNGGYAMAIQSDGKIVVAGYTESFTDTISHCVLIRYNTDGSIDTSFNKTGYVVTIDSGEFLSFISVVIQPNGKILALENNFVLERFNVNGTLDTSFGKKGIALDSIGGSAASLILQPDGKIVAGGTVSNYAVPPSFSDFELVRCDTTGKIDSTFGTDGIVITGFPSINYLYANLQALAIQNDGKIVAGGFSFDNSILYALARYTTNGSLDTTFGFEGIDTNYFSGEINSVAIQTDSKIVAAGERISAPQNNYQAFTVVRYDSTGSFDTGFATNGIDSTTINGYASSLVLQPDEKIIAAGIDFSTGFALLRLNTNGTPDTSFGIGGEVATTIVPSTNYFSVVKSVALQSDGKIVAAGFALDNRYYGNYFAVARYISGLTTGILNLSSTPNSILVYPNPVHNTETLDYTLTNDETLTINLYNVTGQVMKNFMTNEQVLTGEHRQQLSFENLPAGTYILTISNADLKTESIKIVKQ
jgi:uncharacterized delta-60 repeat protein